MVVHYSFVYSLEKDAWLSVNEEAKEEEEEESTGSARNAYCYQYAKINDSDRFRMQQK